MVSVAVLSIAVCAMTAISDFFAIPSSPDSNGVADSFVVSSGGDPERLLDEPGNDGNVTFSPDGTAMAYLATETAGFETVNVYVQRYPPDNAKRLVSREGVISAFPRWVRNGTESPLTLAYQASPSSGSSVL